MALYLENDTMERADTVKKDVEKVESFLAKGCQCSLGPRQTQCSSSFDIDFVMENVDNCRELTARELDLVILGVIQTCYEKEGTLSVGEKRKNVQANLLYRGNRICREMFYILYGIGEYRFRQLQAHYIDNNGIIPRTHGNTNRRPRNAFDMETIKNVKLFVDNYVEDNAIALPGRIPGQKSDDIRLLPSSDTKVGIWRFYRTACLNSNSRSVGYSKFLKLWKELFIDVVIAKPMTDLCNTCQQNNSAILRESCLPGDERSARALEQDRHLEITRREREFYKASCKTSKETYENVFDQIDFTKSRPPCSLDAFVHYSFDFAQQVHIPSNPMQPGPIFFKTPRKCGIFGVYCEAVPC